MSPLPAVNQPFGDELVLRSIDWLENLPWRQENNVRNQKDKYEVTLLVKDFAPEDISVRTADGHVVIECKHEERKDEHGYISRRFTRKYALPDDCRPEDVVSTLSSDGLLTVTAPRQLRMRQDTVIPVTHDNKAKSKL
ncbi:protein lethal(2)essential for life [Amyelois transitella]|uniref:protein lethal(2)essential for life n=1 Tax=Amyelois transitella TaxID=680683 RepID=UPI00067E19EA|nr:protein lethal(2)essential for life [Amyelois transitella]